MIVVFDSGIWISSLRFGGPPLEVVDDVLRRHQIAICKEIVREVEKTLTLKFRWPRRKADEKLSPYLIDALNIEIAGEVRGICRDPDDDMILECAALASAELIVTGDRDLLVLGAYRNIRIITPRQYLDTYG